MGSNNSNRLRGRPRRSPEHLRKHSLRVAVSGVELEAITTRAQARGQRLAVYLRRCAMIGSPLVQELLDLLSRLLAQLRGLASNINQASHRANLLLTKDHPDRAAAAVEQREIAGTLAEVRQLMTEIREAVSRLTTGGSLAASTETDTETEIGEQKK